MKKLLKTGELKYMEHETRKLNKGVIIKMTPINKSEATNNNEPNVNDEELDEDIQKIHVLNTVSGVN